MTLMRWHSQPNLANFFDDMFEKRFELNHRKNCGCNPLTNVIENEDAFLLELSVPGYDKKDISINLDNNVLTISSDLEVNEDKDNTNYTMREFSHNSFSRSFTLPKSVNSDKIKAAYENGILNLTIPKKEEAKIKINKEIKIS